MTTIVSTGSGDLPPVGRPRASEPLTVLATRADPVLPKGGARAGPPILSSGQFVEGFIPPDYLVEGVLQRRFLYSMTAPTGTGKTSIGLFLAANIALRRDIGNLEVQGGRVIYFAGENPDDIRMRWIGMGETMNFDTHEIDVLFIPGVFKISEFEPVIRERLSAIGGVDLVVIDTAAAFYEGTEENDNVAMGNHARRLRGLTLLPGGPTVLVNCHPVKNAAADNLQPRGGGAFIAEVDGNLTCSKKNDLVELHWQGKFRGPDFDPLAFALCPTKTDRLVDSRGRQIPTVVARLVSEAERAEMEKGALREEDALLSTMLAHPNASLSGLAEAAGWRDRSGKPYKTRVNRLLHALEKDRLTKQERSTWMLTEKGRAEAERVKFHADVASVRNG